MSFAQYLAEQEALTEMAINPSSLNRFLASDIASKMTLGIEAEMVMPLVDGQFAGGSSAANEQTLMNASLEGCVTVKEVKAIIEGVVEDITGGDYGHYDRIEEEIDSVFDIDDSIWGSFWDDKMGDYTYTFNESVYEEYEVNGEDAITDIFNIKLREYIEDGEEKENLSDDEVRAIEDLYAKAIDDGDDGPGLDQEKDWMWYGVKFSTSNSQRKFINFIKENQVGNFSAGQIMAVMNMMEFDLDVLVEEKNDNIDYGEFADWYETEHGKNILQSFFDEHRISDVLDFFNRWISQNEVDMIVGSHGGEENDFRDGGISADHYADELRQHVEADVGVNYRYHGENTDRMSDWTLEPDGSIEFDAGYEVGIEFISPPISDLNDALEQIEALFKFLNEFDGSNNDSTGFHINLSLPYDIQQNVDLLKLMLMLGDQHVLAEYGRSNNRFAQSTLKKAKQKLASRSNANEIIELLDELRNKLTKSVPQSKVDHILGDSFGEDAGGSKFVSINVKDDNYIEFRSAGGWDYVNNWPKIKLTILRFAYVLSVSADPELERQEYLKKLYKFVYETIGGSDDPIISKFVQYVSMTVGQTPERIAELRNKLKSILLVKKDIKGGKESVEQWFNRIMDAVNKSGNGRTFDLLTPADLNVIAGDNPTPLEVEYRKKLMDALNTAMYGRIVGYAVQKLNPSDVNESPDKWASRIFNNNVIPMKVNDMTKNDVDLLIADGIMNEHKDALIKMIIQKGGGADQYRKFDQLIRQSW